MLRRMHQHVMQPLPWLVHPSLPGACCRASFAAVEDFDERQVFRARDNAAYTHEYKLSVFERRAWRCDYHLQVAMLHNLPCRDSCGQQLFATH